MKPVDKIFPGAKIMRDADLCPFCGKPIRIEDFRNEKSIREMKISGLCQECQDKMFGVD